MSDAIRVARGHAAERELTETEAAFDAVRDAILREMVSTSPAHPDKVLKLHLAVQNLDAVKTALRGVIEDGQVAAHAIAAAGLTRPY